MLPAVAAATAAAVLFTNSLLPILGPPASLYVWLFFTHVYILIPVIIFVKAQLALQISA
jgi:hypothetical protein